MEHDVKIVIATHKKYDMPQDAIYLPLHVGAEGKEDLGYKKDNTGENISLKNPFFCELTGLYWAWKNLEAEYIGLAHYRRHFMYSKKEDNLLSVLNGKEAMLLLEKSDVILPRKRNYVIETLYDHYKHTLYVEPLDKTREIIKNIYPEYLQEFDKLKIRRSAHMFNMFIMKKEILDGYCKWLFDVLFELEKQVDSSQYDQFHARFYGRISELLLDVYLNTNKIKYSECDFIYMEKIDKVSKIIGFLKAKFGGIKYGKSF